MRARTRQKLDEANARLDAQRAERDAEDQRARDASTARYEADQARREAERAAEEAETRRALMDRPPADHETLAAEILARGSSNSHGGLAGVHAAAQTQLLWAITKRLRLAGSAEHRG